MAATAPLTGQVALVTGASRGVGRAVALELASLGADLVVTARTRSPRADITGTLPETVALLEAKGVRAVGIVADLMVPADVERIVAEALGAFGHVDILVNNAAYIGDAVFLGFWDTPPELWAEQMHLNVNSQYELMHAFAPAMRKRKKGLIVNMGSNDGNVPTFDLPLPGTVGGVGSAYMTTKAAIVHMTKHAGNELRNDGIAVVAITPGYARSESAELLSHKIGLDPSNAQPVEVAAKALGYIATSDDPLSFAGSFVDARALVDEHGLLAL